MLIGQSPDAIPQGLELYPELFDFRISQPRFGPRYLFKLFQAGQHLPG